MLYGHLCDQVCFIGAEHVTTHFRPSAGALAAAAVGRTVALRVLGIASDASAQAIVVEPLPVDGGSVAVVGPAADDAAVSALLGSAGANRVLHITLSAAPGIRPAYSNELIGARGFVAWGASVPEITLRGVVGVRLAHGGTVTDAAEFRRCVIGDVIGTVSVPARDGRVVNSVPRLASTAAGADGGEAGGGSGDGSVPGVEPSSTVLREAAKVHTLNVFDFDGTVAITADEPRCVRRDCSSSADD